MSKECTILDVRIDGPSMKDVVLLCREWLLSTQAHQIATVNPEFVMEAQKNEVFKKVLNNSSLTVADGVGLILFGNLLHANQCQLNRVTGVDLTWELVGMCAELGKSIYLIGGASGVSEKVAEILKTTYPNLVVFSEMGLEKGDDLSLHDLCERVNVVKPDVVLVAFGAPRQDLWIAQHLDHLPSVKIAMGVGGTFDYISGSVKRAPEWMRSIGMEWLFRLVMQPQRWGRIITATVQFPLAALWEWLHQKD